VAEFRKFRKKNTGQDIGSTTRFSLSREFRKKCVGPSPGVVTHIFPENNWRHFLVITVCQFCSIIHIHFLLFWSSLSLLFISLRCHRIISGMLLCSKNSKICRYSCGAPFCGCPSCLAKHAEQA